MLILGLPLGGGHMAAARGIKRQLESASPGSFKIRVIDLSENIHVLRHPISRFIVWFYRISVTTFGGWLYRGLFHLADTQPRAICWLTLLLFGRRASAWLTGQRPDLVISTYPLVTCVAAYAFRDNSVRVVTVVTDAGRVNQLWWAVRSDLLLVTHGDLLKQAHKCGVPPSRVCNIGLVVVPGLDLDLSAEQARRRMGLRNTFTVLLTGGGVGFGPNLERLARCIGRLADRHTMQFLVATGQNPALSKAIIGALPPSSVFVCPPQDMGDTLLAADLVIGKGGWLTISECITAGKPIIVIDAIPGQEDENIRFIETLGIGRRMPLNAALDALVTYSQQPHRLTRDFSTRRDLYSFRVGARLVELTKAMLDARDR